MDPKCKASPCYLLGEVLQVTEYEIVFNIGGAGGKEVTLPKSYIRSCSTYVLGATAKIEIPMWLAVKEGLQNYYDLHLTNGLLNL